MKRTDQSMTTTAGVRVALMAALIVSALLALGSAPAALAAGEPLICSITPSHGPASGGTAVRISGSNFATTTGVTFGNQAATSYSVYSGGWDCPEDSGYILAVTPPGTAGTNVQVRVTNTAGTSTDAVFFHYDGAAGQPAVTDVEPNIGPTAGGTIVTISGAGFSGATAVTFGLNASADWDVVSDSVIVATSPAGAAGTVYVKVTTAAGTSEASAGSQFTYSATLPAVTGLSPAFGPPAGSTTVQITGVNFTGVTAVWFGSTPAAFVFHTSTYITATAPAHIPGTVQVQVQTPYGLSPASVTSEYTYTTDPVAVTSLEPDFGTVDGGTVVTIRGFGFLGASAVQFGGLNADGFTVVNDTKIVAYSPPHVEASVYVRVTVGAFTSAATTSSVFTYVGTGPSVSSLVPASGPSAGGTSVTIYGSGFLGATSVKFGAYSAMYTVVDNTTIVAVAPAQSAGAVYVIVTTPFGSSSATSASVYTYTGTGPSVTALTPGSGPTSGGTTVTITGFNFTGATSVSFGGVSATFGVTNSTTITAVAPAHAAGTVYVVVTTPSGSSAQVVGSQFTYTTATGTVSYTLSFRWTLLTWTGINGLGVDAAVKGLESPDNAATNDVSSRVTAIYYWDSVNQRWRAWFPNASTVPGANDFSTLTKGFAYFIAINGSGSVTWVVFAG